MTGKTMANTGAEAWPVVLEPASEGGFIVNFPDLPNGWSQGESRDEALRLETRHDEEHMTKNAPPNYKGIILAGGLGSPAHLPLTSRTRSAQSPPAAE